jgi:WD40 repeat protein
MRQQRREYSIEFYDRGVKNDALSFNVPAGTHFDIAEFSLDQKFVATDAPDNSVALWDLASRSQIRTFPGPGGPIISVAFSPDGRTLAAGFISGKFRVWDVPTGELRFEGKCDLERPAVTFAPDGMLAVTVARATTQFMDANTGAVLRFLSIPDGALNRIFFSPDGNRLFATTSEGRIYTWSVRDGKPLGFVEAHANEVMSYAFSSDGRKLATGSVDRTLKIWDVEAGKELRTVIGHGGWVTSLNWSGTGQYLLSGDSDGLVKMWDLDAKELPVWPVEQPASVSATGFTSGNELLAVGNVADWHEKLWNLSTGQVIADFVVNRPISTAAFSRDMSMVAVADSKEIRTYSVVSGKPIGATSEFAFDVYSLDFSPDGTKLLSGSRQGKVILSDVSSGQFVAQLNDGNMYYRAVFSPDGKQIASADQDGKVRIWDVASNRIVRTLIAHTGIVRLIAFSPDGRLLATAGDDNTVRIWDADSGQEHAQAIRSDSVQRFVFAPDGKRLVTVSIDGAVVLWDVPGLQEVITLRNRGLTPSSATFSRDGLTLAVSDDKGGVQVWRGGRPAS